MLIKRKVAVKIVVTEQFKQQMRDEVSTAIDKVKLTLQQLERDGARYLSELQRKDSSQAAEFQQKLVSQKRQQEDLLEKLCDKMATTEQLEPGSEYSQGNVEGLAEIQVGDNLFETLKSAELVIKDGIVLEIRHG